MQMTVDIILQEIQIRVDKLKEFELEAEKKQDVDMHRITHVRRMEYESFKNWIEQEASSALSFLINILDLL